SFGVGMAEGMRNAPSLANVVYQPRLFADGGVPSLELQVLAPIGDPLEMAHNILTVSDQLSADPFLNELSQEVFERDIDPFVITRSIAAFERTILSTQSKYDEYLQGSTILNEDELAGMELFNSDELQCSSCHQGALFTDFDYYNIGLYEEYEDSGRERISLDENDNGKFKTPSLRNIALTPPYMHHGSIETLEEVIDFFAAGGLDHPNKDGRVNGFELSEDEKMQLIAFLKTLSDPQLLTNPDF
ncbi:MAG: cytochrome-c peroxidase, partial [Flavobacteriales bacterium]|nr:cytochrome-c peroxidase [Flavobacteriales bacterium]